MSKATKAPSGALYEEYITSSYHNFKNGALDSQNQDSDDGYYTGRICFSFDNGKRTRWYQSRHAPKWMQALWDIAQKGAEDEQ